MYKNREDALNIEKKQVLIVGGYGAIGSNISRLLSKCDELVPIIAGRSSQKASRLAKDLGCSSRTIDVNDEKSIKSTLQDVDIVISCYADPDNSDVLLPKKAIEAGCHYIDLSGRDQYNRKIIALNRKAYENNVILITGLGLNPGIIGLLIADSRNCFEKIGILEVYLTMGGNMSGVSELSLRDMGYMIQRSAKQYNGKKWVETNTKGKDSYMGEPFNKKIKFYPGMITSDVINISKDFSSNKIVLWTGTESLMQRAVLYFGIQKGFMGDLKKIRRFLKVLQFIGRNKNKHSLVKIIQKGSCKNIKHERIIEFYAKEELLTAIAPVIVCEQIASGKIKHPGAFFAPQAVDTCKFFHSFKKKDVNYKESIKKFKIMSKLKN